MEHKKSEWTDYGIFEYDGMWSIKAKDMQYTIDIPSNGGGLQHNFSDEHNAELQSLCEKVLASMINLDKFLKSTPTVAKEDASEKERY